MESKRACCAPTVSPPSTSIGNQKQDSRYQPTIRKPKENCDLRKCNYAKSPTEKEFCNTQKLLDKIQYLKKSIQELEITQKRGARKTYKRRDAPSQTQDLPVTDLNSAREALSTCVAQMTKLKEFLDDDNCWWKLFKKREFNCCGQKSPHLHGYLDGTMVTLRMLEETSELDNNFATSTPIKSNLLECPIAIAEPQPEETKKNVEQCTNTPGVEMKKYVDSSVNPHQSLECSSSKAPVSCQANCPVSCTHKTENDSIPEKPKEMKDEGTGEPVYDDSEEKEETPIEMDQRTSSAAHFSKELYYAKSSANLDARSRPKYTFHSENTPNRKVLVTNISTSMDLIADTTYNSIAVATTGLNSITERNFSLSPSRMPPRSKRREM